MGDAVASGLLSDINCLVTLMILAPFRRIRYIMARIYLLLVLHIIILSWSRFYDLRLELAIIWQVLFSILKIDIIIGILRPIFVVAIFASTYRPINQIHRLVSITFSCMAQFF